MVHATDTDISRRIIHWGNSLQKISYHETRALGIVVEFYGITDFFSWKCTLPPFHLKFFTKIITPCKNTLMGIFFINPSHFAILSPENILPTTLNLNLIIPNISRQRHIAGDIFSWNYRIWHVCLPISPFSKSMSLVRMFEWFHVPLNKAGNLIIGRNSDETVYDLKNTLKTTYHDMFQKTK